MNTHDTEAGYSVEQVHRLQPGMIRPTHSSWLKAAGRPVPFCYAYREPRRPVPWLVAFAIVVGCALIIKAVA